MNLSVIVPIYNEQDNLIPLCEKLVAELKGFSNSFEIVIVNDGSTDQSEKILADLSKKYDCLKVVNFVKNFGQTAALMAGFENSSGEIIVPMDGDLQNDPKDIPRLIAKLNEGYDVVSGWRRHRKDPFVRTILSQFANKLISKVSGVRLNDYGCTLKTYRRSVIKNIRLYGEMHRFIPIYASWQGAKVIEMEVAHHPRVANESKYGIDRTFKVMLDLMVVKFLAKYFQKPIYVFGTFGFICFVGSFISGMLTVYFKIFQGTSFILTPLPLLCMVLFLTGVQSIFTGLLAEVLMRTYFESQNKLTYIVKSVLGP